MIYVVVSMPELIYCLSSPAMALLEAPVSEKPSRQRWIMPSALDYREMARECLREAEQTRDADRKKVLLQIAKLYTRTALAMEGVVSPENCASPTP